MLGKVEILLLKEEASYQKILEYLKGEKLPLWFLEEVYILKIPEKDNGFLVDNYNLIQKEEYHRLKFSFEDFAIAYLASLYSLMIFSYDKDLLVEIKEYLDYDVISPESIPHIPQHSIVLLDTNILFALIDPEQKKFQDVFKQIITEHTSITFTIPELILAEFENTKKKIDGKKNKEPDYSEFIDDDTNFAPKKRPRKKEYKQYKGEKDWSVSKRYRKIL